jgi:hypothetical protein
MKKVSNVFLVSVSLLIITFHVLSNISKLNNFEDELIILTSHLYFLTELEFKAPLLVENEIFTPALTTGFNSLFLFLLLNILNLQYESRNYFVNNLNISEYKENISSIACIDNYLPYDYKTLDY